MIVSKTPFMKRPAAHPANGVFLAHKAVWESRYETAADPNRFDDAVCFGGNIHAEAEPTDLNGPESLETDWTRWVQTAKLPEDKHSLQRMQRKLNAFSGKRMTDPQRQLLTACEAMLTERALCMTSLGTLNSLGPMGSAAYEAVLHREGFALSPRELEAALAWHAKARFNQLQRIFPREDPFRVVQVLAHRSPESDAELLQSYRQLFETAEKLVRRHNLVRLPDNPVSFHLAAVESAFVPVDYNLDGARLTVFKSSDLPAKAHSFSKIPMRVAHELMPGHHVALTSLYKNQTGYLLPDIGYNSFFREGWATYAERLMSEHGLMDKSESQFALAWHHWELAEMARENVAHHCDVGPKLTEPDIQDYYNAERYNPVSYYLGFLQILDLRKQVLALHPEMSLREFHDRLLACPELPVPQMAQLAFSLVLKPLRSDDLKRLL